MAKEEEKKEEAPAEVKPKSKKKLIIIIAVVVLLLGAGVPAFMMMSGGEDKKAAADGEGHEEHAEEEHGGKHYRLAKLDPFIANLGENTAFVKVTMLIEYDPEILENSGSGHGGGGAYGAGGSGGGDGAESTALPPVMKAREPVIRDSILRVLASKKTAEVLTGEGKEKLKEELIEAINEATGLEQGPVVNIYFTEFIVQ